MSAFTRVCDAPRRACPGLIRGCTATVVQQPGRRPSRRGATGRAPQDDGDRYSVCRKKRARSATPAAARSRRACSSTARSGMVTRKVAPMVPSTRRMSPSCARTSSAAMTRPRPEPPVRVELLNGSNRCARAASGMPGPVSDDLDLHHRALAAAGDADLVAAGIAGVAALQRLHRIAREIEQDAEQLVGIGVDHQPALDRADPADRRVGRKLERLAHLLAPAARARSGGGPAAAPARGRRTASTRRTRSRARAPASAWARSAAPAGPASSTAGRRTIARTKADCAGRG